MGLYNMQEVASSCRYYDNVAAADPACTAAELIWLKYFAYSRLLRKQLSVEKIEVYVYGNPIIVEGVFKEEDRSIKTGLVLRSTNKPELEGMILSDDDMHTPLRPFCVFANYDLNVPARGQSLKKAVEKIGLTYYVENGLAHLLRRLLLINKLSLSVGEHFWDNLYGYGEYAKASGLVRATWEDT